MKQPRISVLMPSLNVCSYIRECIESVINQTLSDIEVICIDAGSTDGTREILQEYAEHDKRIMVLDSDIKSYGHQMNMGLKSAHGRFIGIVETDDFIDHDMYERLYDAAVKHDAQVVKANFYDYFTSPLKKSVFHERYKGLPYDRILNDEERPRLFSDHPCIWSGIYDRELLNSEGIDFLESPGASFQDTSFMLKVWVAAQRVVLLRDAYLHYRKDNLSSSVHSIGKTYYICDEMIAAHEFMDRRSDWHDLFCESMWSRRAESYIWNYKRLADEERLDFLKRMYQEMTEAQTRGELHERAFRPYPWKTLCEILDDPEAFYESHRGKTADEHEAREQPELSHREDGSSSRMYADASDRELVSVIIAAYNTKDYIVETLQDVLAQSYQPYEVIIVDDGSTDGTIMTIEQQFAHDDRIQIYRLPHNNAGVARNVGLRYARGTYLQFLDADDRYPDTMLEKLVTRAEATSAQVVCCGSENFIDATGKVQMVRQTPRVEDDSRSYPAIAFDGGIFNVFMGWAWDKIFRRDFVSTLGLEFQSLSSTNDAYFVFCALALADRIAIVNEVLPRHRIHAGSIERSRQSVPHNAYHAQRAIVERLEGEAVWPQLEESFTTWSITHLRWNYKSLELPERCDAFEDYRRAIESAASRYPDALNDEDRSVLKQLAEADTGRLWVQVAELERLLEQTRAELKTAQEKADEREEALKRSSAELETLRHDFDAVVNSQSFRLGRVLTAVPRKARDTLRRD